jgi:hypothetical protein
MERLQRKNGINFLRMNAQLHCSGCGDIFSSGI